MASSSSLPRGAMMKEGERRNWAELPPELTSLFIQRLGTIEMVEKAEKVCSSWRRVCKDPSLWRKIEMRNLGALHCKYYEKMCRHAVGRSHGGLVEIHIWQFGTDSLLSYIAHSSRNLRSLKVAMCPEVTDEGLVEAVVKLPLLEDLEVSYLPYLGYRSLSGDSLKVVGQSCPNLKTFTTNCVDMYPGKKSDDVVALAIAETMPGLRHLQLCGNRLTGAGLNAILDNCPNLEHLDLRKCSNVGLSGDLKKRCYERIKVVRHPFISSDVTEDYPYGFCDTDVSEDKYYRDHSDISDSELDYSDSDDLRF